MKKIFLIAALALGFAVAASAQPRAIGVRVGNGGEVSYQHSLGNNFLEVDGKTFEAAYLDEAMTEKIEQNIDGRERYVDYESGIASTTTVKIYIAWENAPAVAS